jgi:hypothetical protein
VEPPVPRADPVRAAAAQAVVKAAVEAVPEAA